MAVKAPPIPMARAPTGILRNSPAYLVAWAVEEAAREQTTTLRNSRIGKRLMMPVTSVSNQRFGRDRQPYEAPSSDVNRMGRNVPLGPRDVVGDSHQPPLSADARQLAARDEAQLLGRSPGPKANLV